MIKIPEAVAEILKKLNQAGHSAYIVGGCVRDSLLGLEPKDWDVCTSASPSEMKMCFKDYHVLETGLKHGTLTIRLNQKSYEVTTFRQDGEYSDCRHPKSVSFVKDVSIDLARRDFTVNAMAYHPVIGLVDAFDGKNDLKKRVIRAVGEAKKRFSEDALRIMRGLRFASVYGFSVEHLTTKAMYECSGLLKAISAERISEELKKMLLGKSLESILQEYRNIFGVILPEILPTFDFSQQNPHHLYDVWTHTVKALAASKPDLIVRLALLFHDIGKPATFTIDADGIWHFNNHASVSESICVDVLKRLKFDSETVSLVSELVRYHDTMIAPTQKSVKRMLNRIGIEQFERLLWVKEGDALATAKPESKLNLLNEIYEVYQEIIEQNQCFSLKYLAIGGSDLLSMGIPRGKKVGEVLNLLLEKVIDGELSNTADDLLTYVQTIL